MELVDERMREKPQVSSLDKNVLSTWCNRVMIGLVITKENYMYSRIGIKYLSILRYIPGIFKRCRCILVIFNLKDSYSRIGNRQSDIFSGYSISADIVAVHSRYIQKMPAYSRYIRTSRNMRMAILAS